MLSHPPIQVNDLADHIDDLKVPFPSSRICHNDNYIHDIENVMKNHLMTTKQGDGAAKFTTEYESIEPGQQFTWDNSSMDINKPKNR